MQRWGRIAGLGGSILLAMGLVACGSPVSGASTAKGVHKHHAAASHTKRVKPILRYGPIPWPSQLKADKTDPHGYVLTTKAQIKKLPKPVAAAVRTALKTEKQYLTSSPA